MFKKKLKLKISHYGSGYYNVLYSNYRIIPIYHYIREWNSFSNELCEALFSIDKAEDFVLGIKSINDICSFHQRQEEKQREWQIEKKIKKKKAQPYYCKTFIK